MANPVFIACDAASAFGATHTGLGDWVWCDFASKPDAERFALYCALEGYGVYLSRTFADRNRVMVNPAWER